MLFWICRVSDYIQNTNVVISFFFFFFKKKVTPELTMVNIQILSAVTAIDTSGMEALTELKKMLNKKSLQVIKFNSNIWKFFKQ